MVAQHISDLLTADFVGYCLGAFGVGFAISLLFTMFKKMGEKI